MSQSLTCPSCGSPSVVTLRVWPQYVVMRCRRCRLYFGHSGSEPQGNAFHDYSWTRSRTRTFDEYVASARLSLEGKLSVIRSMGGSPRNFLDIGCGNGAFLAAANMLRLSAKGTDLDGAAVSFARSQGLDAVRCKVLDYPAEPLFDFIHVRQTLHLVPETAEFFRCIAERLSIGGFLYIDSTHQHGLASRWRMLAARPNHYGQLYPPLHNRSFDSNSLHAAVATAGLTPRTVFTYSRGHPVYSPSNSVPGARRLFNGILDFFHLGGFIACYAVREVSQVP